MPDPPSSDTHTHTHVHTLLIHPLHDYEPREAYLPSAICLCLVGGLLSSDWLVTQAVSFLTGSVWGISNVLTGPGPAFTS